MNATSSPTTAGPAQAATIALSLVSHTNVGKTTLARTLLGRDIGEVRDAPHVTEFADVHTLVSTEQGDLLQLWDTPGFGDSVRLLERLRGMKHPLGWFPRRRLGPLAQPGPFWASQQALRTVRDHADVVLYLVSAAEEPDAAGYVAPEMDLLAWVGRPVIVLLNQLGAPRPAEVEAAEIERWRRHLADRAHVVRVLPLDAFARCWVQEFTLFSAIEAVLPTAKVAAMDRLREIWQARRLETFNRSMDAIAGSLARIAASREVLPDGGGLRGRLRDLGAALGLGPADRRPAAIAQQALAAQLDVEVRHNTGELIALHGLQGEAQGEILSRLATHYELRLRVGEGPAAVVGAMLTGAIAGLKADIATGGLTLGGGLLAGGLIGALGAAGLARCYNLVRGTRQSWLTWNAEALHQMVEAALLRYLAVAHFGRGRGDWAQAEVPPHWQDIATESLAPYRDAFDEVWSSRSLGSKDSAQQPVMAFDLRPLVTQAIRAALERLYPDTLPAGESATR